MLALDESAINAITRLAADSYCVNPVAALGKGSRAFDVSDALRDAVLSKDEQRIGEVAQKEWNLAKGKVKLFTQVYMVERTQVRAEEIMAIDGIDFHLPAGLCTLLQEARLFYEGGFFVLRDRERRIIEMP